MLKAGGLVKTVVALIPSTALIVLTVAESAKRYTKMANADEALFESIDRQFDRLYEENRLLRQCLMHALNYRPLPSDPLQEFIMQRCPDVIKEWKERRKVKK